MLVEQAPGSLPHTCIDTLTPSLPCHAPGLLTPRWIKHTPRWSPSFLQGKTSWQRAKVKCQKNRRLPLPTLQPDSLKSWRNDPRKGGELPKHPELRAAPALHLNLSPHPPASSSQEALTTYCLSSGPSDTWQSRWLPSGPKQPSRRQFP